MRTALQSRDYFGKLQMRNKLAGSFKGDKGISFQCDLEMKKSLFSWEKEVGGEGHRGERNVSLQLNLQLYSLLLS